MCRTEACLGYLFLTVIFGYAILIFGFLKSRKHLNAKDLQINSEQIWQMRPRFVLSRNISKSDMIFGVWRDKTATISELVVKNSFDKIIGVVEHRWGSREYRIVLGDQIFRVELPLIWGGVVANLVSEDGKIQAIYERKSLSLVNHKFTIINSGELKSKRSLFRLRQSIEYSLNEKFVGMTYQISPFRKIGRVGFFQLNDPLPIKIFILAICI